MSAEILASAELHMKRAIEAMERDFQRIRTGRASASLLEGVRVDHRGSRTPLDHLASITIPDPRQVVVQPWDRSALRAIGKAIAQAGIGLTPTLDGSAVRLYFPSLTEERRRELVGLVRKRMEQARVDIRSLRHDASAALHKEQKVRGTGADDVHRDIERLQRMADRFSAEVDRLGQVKEQRLLEG
jgi:ribosome recycling factor